MHYRYHTGRALRPKGHPFGEFDGHEIRSEDFESLADFLSECIKQEEELLFDRIEGDNDETDDY